MENTDINDRYAKNKKSVLITEIDYCYYIGLLRMVLECPDSTNDTSQWLIQV